MPRSDRQRLSLAPPAFLRQRASSTSMRPAITSCSLGARKPSTPATLVLHSSHFDDPVPGPSSSSEGAALQQAAAGCAFVPAALSPVPDFSRPSSPAPAAAAPPSPPSTFVARLASKAVSFMSATRRSDVRSMPSSPRSSTDTLLPLSASPETTVFGDVMSEKLAASKAHRQGWWPSSPSIHAPILVVLMLFPVSTALVVFAMSTLPITVSWPHNIGDLAQLARELRQYTVSGSTATLHVIAVMSITAIWKHAWSIPGSVLWNVLAGVLFTPLFGTVLLGVLTTIGSLFATLLAKPLAPLITYFFPRALALGRAALEGDAETDMGTKSRGSAWVRLSVLRLIGVVPWSGINIACGVCGVSLYDCALGTFIGTLPWTAVTCQIGDILQTVASQPSPTPQSVSSLLASPYIIGKLVFLSFLSLAPILGRDRLRASISGRHSATVSEEERRWRWVKEWRMKIRLPSRSRERREVAEDLDVLIREKRREETP